MNEKSRQRTVHIVCSFFQKEETEGGRKKEKEKEMGRKLASYTCIANYVKTHKNLTAFD